MIHPLGATGKKAIFNKTDQEHVIVCQKEALLVVSLPELDWTDVGGDEDGTAQEGVERRGEDGRYHSLDKQHGGIWSSLGQGSPRQTSTRAYSFMLILEQICQFYNPELTENLDLEPV